MNINTLWVFPTDGIQIYEETLNANTAIFIDLENTDGVSTIIKSVAVSFLLTESGETVFERDLSVTVALDALEVGQSDVLQVELPNSFLIKEGFEPFGNVSAKFRLEIKHSLNGGEPFLFENEAVFKLVSTRPVNPEIKVTFEQSRNHQ